MYNSVGDFIKKEAVCLIALAAAVISCFLVPRTNYLEYIDTNIIGVLFSLMAVVSGFAENNVFKKLSEKMTGAVGSTRRLALLLVMSCFFLSMLVTNDVALITFVPFTLLIYSRIGKSPIAVIVLQTIAANMGSMLTPIGNPQNLYLFTRSGMTAGDFFKLTVPVTLLFLVLLLISTFFIKNESVEVQETEDSESVEITNKRYLVLYAILFVMCILTVFKLLDMIVVFASVCVVIAIIQPVLFSRVDYGLLATFAFFFIFVGNIKNVSGIHDNVSALIVGHEFEWAVACSQVISNVPAAVMLSAFTENYGALVLGTDIGGLGTLIASLASLISYKLYVRDENADARKYTAAFTVLNILFLAAAFVFAKILLI